MKICWFKSLFHQIDNLKKALSGAKNKNEIEWVILVGDNDMIRFKMPFPTILIIHRLVEILKYKVKIYDPYILNLYRFEQYETISCWFTIVIWTDWWGHAWCRIISSFLLESFQEVFAEYYAIRIYRAHACHLDILINCYLAWLEFKFRFRLKNLC